MSPKDKTYIAKLLRQCTEKLSNPQDQELIRKANSMAALLENEHWVIGMYDSNGTLVGSYPAIAFASKKLCKEYIDSYNRKLLALEASVQKADQAGVGDFVSLPESHRHIMKPIKFKEIKL